MWWTALVVGYLLAGALAFAPGLGAGFVSDTFTFLEGVNAASWERAAAWFVPVGSTFYRPLYLVALAIAQRFLGADPIGYHLIAWLAHVLSALVLAAVGLAVTRDRTVAAVAGFAFLWAIHAHEVVYDVACLHHALGGLLLLVAVLAWVQGRRALSLIAVAVGLLVNELALLALPTLAWYELCFGATPGLRRRASAAARRLAFHAALVVGYFAFRLGLAQAGLPSEGDTCLGLRCLAVAAAEYTNRLLVRPDSLIAYVWIHRAAMALAGTVSAAVVFGLLRPPTWRRSAAALFAAGWTLIGVAYAVLALWPYVSDRFLYAPNMGLSLLLGCLVGEAVRAWGASSSRRRALRAAGIGALAAWVAVGGATLRHRGALWSAAGSEAERLVMEIHAGAPAPPANATFCVNGVPDSYRTTIAPGNTGPYVFRNGLPSALRLRYSRSDLFVHRNCTTASVVVWLTDGRVTVKTTP